MDWIKSVGRLARGVGQAIFVAPAKAWSVVRWLILLGVLAASFQEDARRFIENHPVQFGLAALAYGALLYAYDLQRRLEATKRVQIVIRECWAGFRLRQEHPSSQGTRQYKNIIHARIDYEARNSGDPSTHSFPLVRWFARESKSAKWRELDPEPVFAPTGYRRGGPHDSQLGTHFGRGKHLEIPARQISEWSAQWEAAFPNEKEIGEQEIRLEVTFEVLGQEPQVHSPLLKLDPLH